MKTDRAAEIAALQAAGQKLDALLDAGDDEVEAMVEDYKAVRRARR